MPANYVLLEKITVGATAVATVAFSGIPQTGYTDLVVKASIRSSRSSTNDAFYVYFNTDTTAANYKLRLLYSTGAAANSYTSSTYNDSTGWVSGNSTNASTFSNAEFYIPNYTSANAKSVSYDSVGENNATDAHMGITASSWTGTAAINKITFGSANGANFMQHSTFYLYGVAKLGTTPAIVPYATGGDTIMTDGTYWYHIFGASGSFVPAKSLSCSVIAIGGGGSGGSSTGGGGGGGEVETYSTISTTANTSYTATVGAGGAAHGSQSVQYSGSSSTFSTITALGGGGGGNEQTITNGAAGGSGGGGGWQGSGGSASGANTFGGGNGYNASGQSAGGGGGGATAAGANATNTNAGAGGAGYLVSSLDSALSTIGPFASMTRVSSGGGAGASSTRTASSGGTGAGNGTNSTTDGGNATSFGSGGGGGGWVGGVGAGGGGSGYSGVVVVRYPV